VGEVVDVALSIILLLLILLLVVPFVGGGIFEAEPVSDEGVARTTAAADEDAAAVALRHGMSRSGNKCERSSCSTRSHAPTPSSTYATTAGTCRLDELIVEKKTQQNEESRRNRMIQ
jgi:hypothetical protein